MKQFFCHYEKWEDYQNGMYDDCSVKNIDNLIEKAIMILSNEIMCKKSMKRVTNEWPISTKVNLTNRGVNQIAWLGQAACCIINKVPEEVTRKAWWLLSKEKRNKADNIAKQIIEEWREDQECQKLF